MKKVIVIGSGISGMSAAVRLAEAGIHVMLVSPFPSERSQSVMAAGGINAVLSSSQGPALEGDSTECHIADTLKAGAYLAGEKAVTGLCRGAEGIIRYLEKIGTVFSVDEAGEPIRRSFGGQSFRRTYYCGTSTGKQIVSALVMEVRRFEAAGLIERKLGACFHSAMIREGVCYGVLLFDEGNGGISAYEADAVVIASGGQNALFGKTTGSTQCDGYTAARLFTQGAVLKNLEFIQYHPTTLLTPQKKMLISEAVRGEGGRLFYEEKGRRVYFMEEKYGPKGNLMTRDVISQEMDALGREVFLDISFLGEKEIEAKLLEVRELCRKYGNLDISKEPIPVTPSVHFFMGGLAVHLNHETNIHNLFAVGECASMYHGANRLGGNSLLAALYSGKVAAEAIASREEVLARPDFTKELQAANEELLAKREGKSPFPVMYIRQMLAETMQKHLGISRNEASLEEGIRDVDYYLSVSDQITFDNSVLLYELYSLKSLLILAKAVLLCARERRESRGAHFRSDYPSRSEEEKWSTLITCEEGAMRVFRDKELSYES